MNSSLQLKRGIWYGVIYYKDEIGNDKQKWISTGLPERGNKKAAKEFLDNALKDFEEKLAEAKQRIEQRSKPKKVDKSDAVMLFSEYVKKYIEEKKADLSPEVYTTYSVHYIVRIKEFFDERKLRLIDVTKDEINDFHNYLKNAGLKNKSIKNYDCVLRPALKQAFQKQLIPDNPFDFADKIKKTKPQISFYDKREVAIFLEAIKGHSFELAFKIAAYYGFRRSEILGIRWSSIDFEHKLIHVNHKLLVVGAEVHLSDELKTKASNRTLPLFPEIEKDLKQLKLKTEENKNQYKEKYDNRYEDYIFVNKIGKIIYPDNLTDSFSTVLKKCKLKKIRLHDLRHSCASIMLANGVSMKEIQEWLGHANYSTTADVYTHLDFNSKIQSAAIMEKALKIYPDSTKDLTNAINSEAIKTILLDMRSRGIENIDDYLTFISQGNNQKQEKSECQM